jgi:protease I
MSPSPKKALVVIAPERFRDEEFAEPKRALEGAGHRVSVGSTRSGTATGMLGARVTVDLTVAQAKPEDYDVLVVVGGAGSPAHLWESEPLRGLVKALHAAGKPVGAICLSPPVLARAGILAGKRATTYPAERAIVELKRGGATYVEDPVVRDGTIITASGPEAASAFARTLVELLAT